MLFCYKICCVLIKLHRIITLISKIQNEKHETNLQKYDNDAVKELNHSEELFSAYNITREKCESLFDI